VKVKPTSGLTQEEVDKLVTEADRFKYADELRRELAEVRNQAETLLYTTEAALEGYANLVDGKMLDDTRTLAKELRGLLESQADLAAIRDAYQKLETMTFAIAEKMYGGDGGDAPPAQT
jgi:molecular chaperone DnaK